MKHLFFALSALLTTSLFALESNDERAIRSCIEKYAHAWNEPDSHGFADDFTENADFVNIFGMHYAGKEKIQQRHNTILETFLKGTKFGTSSIELREEQTGLVIATVHWTLDGYVQRDPKSPNIKQGIFSHVFVNRDGEWKICATQNTLMPAE